MADNIIKKASPLKGKLSTKWLTDEVENINNSNLIRHCRATFSLVKRRRLKLTIIKIKQKNADFSSAFLFVN